MFAHERLDVYQLSIVFVSETLTILSKLPRGHGELSSQLKRSSCSIPLNIAEGVGKTGEDDKKRFFSIARGSATESAAMYDVLFVAGLNSESEVAKGKAKLNRIVAMLTALCHR